MAIKSDKKPARGRYASENHLLMNKISKLTRYSKEHPKDEQVALRLIELQSQVKKTIPSTSQIKKDPIKRN